VPALLLSIPSPDRGVIDLGPIELRAYGFLIGVGVAAAVWLAARRWAARGGDPGAIHDIAIWAVPGGIIGARIYHVATDYQLYTDDWLRALEIWHGGLGIWGGILGGVLTGVFVARRRGYPLPQLLDAAAPALSLAQAIGRWGNWFNQELFGRPTDLPWGLEIDPSHRPLRYARFDTFHPTFLYESLWCLLTVGVVLLAERRARLRPGRLIAVYVATYTFGRFFIELLRIDPAHRIAGLRLNDWTSVVVFAAAAGFLVVDRRRHPPTGDERDETPAAPLPLGEP
jgi:prolipoprotein diacylglyceryl transferase